MLCHDILGTNAKARSIGDKRKAFLYLRRAGEGAGPLLCVGNQESDSVRSYWIDAETGGAETPFWIHFFTANDQFTKTGSGQTYRKS
jgi:hypothetical protein